MKILVATKKRGIGELLEQEKSIAVLNMTVSWDKRGIGELLEMLGLGERIGNKVRTVVKLSYYPWP